MFIVGIDLAWQTEKNGTAIAVGRFSDTLLTIERLFSPVIGVDNIAAIIEEQEQVAGISIDAPLIIRNKQGQRLCERQLNKRYRQYKAGCHPSNLQLYPNAGSVMLAEKLENRGFKHLGNPINEAWQIECYPHPAIVELFQLKQRLPYKKGNVNDKKQGQCRLAELIKSLNKAKLKLDLHEDIARLLEKETILGHRGRAIKQNEDALDAIVCAYIGACYARDSVPRIFGDKQDGYIYVPGPDSGKPQI